MADLKLPTIILCEEPNALARSTADVVRAVAERAIAERGGFSCALAGGSTPRALYGELAVLGTDFIEWSRVALYWGDERLVPPDHEASNYRMVKESLLDHVTPGAVHRIETELGAERAAAHYSEKLAISGALDLVLLGMGEDGHTASLFPDTPDLDTRARVVVTTSPAPPHARISLSLSTLNQARDVALMVTGAAKAARLAEAYREIAARAPELPVSMVQPAGRYLWIIDEAAAAELRSSLSPTKGEA